MDAKEKKEGQSVVTAVSTILKMQYLAGFMDIDVSPTVMENMMYFMEEAGERGPYYVGGGEGTDLEGTGWHAKIDCGKLSAGSVHEAWRFLNEYPETRARVTRVCKLIEGFESEFGISLLWSVLWSITRVKVLPSLQGVHIAAEHLKRLGWISEIPTIGEV